MKVKKITKKKLSELNNYEPHADCNIENLLKFKVCVGDRVALPEFTVPAITIDGENKMDFEEHIIKDNAIIYKITKKYIYLVFEHCLFQSAIDLNEKSKWKKTQLYQYLHITFKKAMKDAGIKAKKVNLLSYDEVFGKKQLDYFKYAKNRIAVDLKEEKTWYYWLKAVDFSFSSTKFCRPDSIGEPDYKSASNTNCFLRSRFAIKIKT